MIGAPALLLALPFLQSFTLTPIDTLRLVDARRVPVAALPDPGALPNAGEFVWKVSLTGGSSWVRTIRAHQMNGYPVVVRCDDRNATLFAAGPYVGSVLIAHGATGLATLDTTPRTLRYDIYLPVTGRYTSAADFNAPMPSYDLGNQRIQLCIRLGGGAMTGIRARSNEVRVTIGA